MDRVQREGKMKYYVDRKKRYNLRCHGSYANYPVFDENNKLVSILECYATDINYWLNNEKIEKMVKENIQPFFKIVE